MDEVVVEYGPNGEAYLVLRKVAPKPFPKQIEREESKNSEVIIIDMFEDSKVSYEF